MTARGAAVFLVITVTFGLVAPGWLLNAILRGQWRAKRKFPGAKPLMAALAGLLLSLGGFVSLCSWNLGWGLTALSTWSDVQRHLHSNRADEIERDAETLERCGRWAIPWMPGPLDARVLIAADMKTAAALRQRAAAMPVNGPRR